MKGEQSALVALAGNPNVGKSTVFNALTGGRQHTGNWSGKTVGIAMGEADADGIPIRLVDLPGTYALHAHSPEEEIARDFLCRQKPDAVILVCDAGCLERNLSLVLQTLEITTHAVLCVNFMDEAEKRGISVNLHELSDALGIPVVGTAARQGEGLPELMQAVRQCMAHPPKRTVRVAYPKDLEAALDEIQPYLTDSPAPRADAVRLLTGEYPTPPALTEVIAEARAVLLSVGYDEMRCQTEISAANVRLAEAVCRKVVQIRHPAGKWSAFLDRCLTGRWTGIPTMLLMLLAIFWLTVYAANIPSELLGRILSCVGQWLNSQMLAIGASSFVRGLFIDGVYTVSARVVSVMLPPMAIFFPLFTLLEDAGILPRIAFNLDNCFRRAKTCGKQALTMCMGLGCNAVGVTGCRIIDSPRERKIAMLTNVFVPCNGKYPAMILLISLYFTAQVGNLGAAMLLTGIILLGIFLTFAVSAILAKTLLRGTPSAFTLELPPIRKPQFGAVIVRSVLDRTLFVLGRAISVAAPAGAVIWLLANIRIAQQPLLQYMTQFLEPFGRILGMDGTLLASFLLGFPANEIVLPICALAYSGAATLTALTPTELKTLFAMNGWTARTAICVLLFFLCHWPCATTVLTVKKESKSLKWALWSVVIPTAVGVLLCASVNGILQLWT